jgi:hypothetical protein
MRAAVAALLCSLPTQAGGLDLEIAPGWTWSTDVAASGPVLRARGGYDLGWLTPSISAFAAPLDPGNVTHRQGGGIQGWGFAAELRVHAQRGLFAALGAGIGKLGALQSASDDAKGYRGAVAPYVEAAAGYQFTWRKVRVGLELTVDVFNRVHLVGDLGSRFCVDTGGLPGSSIQFCPTGRSFPLVGLALTLGGNPSGPPH